jgi:hypothetical protein
VGIEWNMTILHWLSCYRNFFTNGQKPEWAREKDKKTNIDASQLTEFFSLLSEPLKVVQHRSLSFDPWEVAGLGRKEVRNCCPFMAS